MEYYFQEEGFHEDVERRDPEVARVKEYIREFFLTQQEEVFFSRQIEIHFEDDYFHWITKRALRELEEEGFIKAEMRDYSDGGRLKLMWYKGYRYYKIAAKKVVKLVEEYSQQRITRAIGLNGEHLVLEGFATKQFLTLGRNTKKFGDKEWLETEHNLDFIFERDGIVYGVEVKNRLGYMDEDELNVKIRMCHFLGIKPLFIVRMIPRTWTYEIIKNGGFALILKYQLYPIALMDFAQRVANNLKLPVDSPQALEEGTMKRFIDWHIKTCELEK